MDIKDNLISNLLKDTEAGLTLPSPYLLDYYRDLDKRILNIDDEINDDDLAIARNIMRFNVEDKGLPVDQRVPIIIMINSPGGEMQCTWSIINAIRISKTPVYTVTYCTAMSAAALILASGHKRFAMPGSTILVHSGSCAYSGDVEKVESAKKYYDGFSKNINEYLAKVTKISPKELKRRGAVDWFMTAEEAQQNGVIDTIIDDFDQLTYDVPSCIVMVPTEI